MSDINGTFQYKFYQQTVRDRIGQNHQIIGWERLKKVIIEINLFVKLTCQKIHAFKKSSFLSNQLICQAFKSKFLNLRNLGSLLTPIKSFSTEFCTIKIREPLLQTIFWCAAFSSLHNIMMFQ